MIRFKLGDRVEFRDNIYTVYSLDAVGASYGLIRGSNVYRASFEVVDLEAALQGPNRASELKPLSDRALKDIRDWFFKINRV